MLSFSIPAGFLSGVFLYGAKIMNNNKCSGIVHVKEHMREGHKVAAYDRRCGRHNYHDYMDFYPSDSDDKIYERDSKSRNSKQKGNMLSDALVALLQLFWAIKDGDTLGYLQAINALVNSPFFQVFTDWIGQFGITTDMLDFKERAAEFLASDEGQAELANALQQLDLPEQPFTKDSLTGNSPLNLDKYLTMKIQESVSSKYANLDDVAQVKGALAVLGYYTPPKETGMTPYMDDGLISAIKNFQKDNGLAVTGILNVDGPELEIINSKIMNPVVSSADAYIKGGGTHNYMDKYERTQAMIDGRKLRFEINDNNWTITAAPHEIPELGVYNVKSNENLVNAFSKKHGVDPDMVKAIMYMEGANGHHLGLNYLRDDIGQYPDSFVSKTLGKVIGSSTSVMPMNIQNQWGRGFIGTQYDPYNREQNIEAGVKLIKRISESIENPTPEKIGSMWNGIMVDNINDVGARVGKYYREKPWKGKNWSPIKTYLDYNSWLLQYPVRESINKLKKIF